MKKTMICAVVIFLVASLCSIGTLADAPPIRCEMDFKIEDFIYLRDAVSAENESGVVEFFNCGTPHRHYDEDMLDLVKPNISWGKTALEILDQLAFLDFNCDQEELKNRILVLESYSLGKGTGAVYMEYELPQGIHVKCQYLTTVKDIVASSPEFVLKSKEDEEIQFAEWNTPLCYKGYYTPVGGKTVIITIQFPKGTMDLQPLVEEIGAWSFVPFTEIVPKEDSSFGMSRGVLLLLSFGSIVVVGGVAVIGGGAAVILLRRKKKKAVTAAEE